MKKSLLLIFVSVLMLCIGVTAAYSESNEKPDLDPIGTYPRLEGFLGTNNMLSLDVELYKINRAHFYGYIYGRSVNQSNQGVLGGVGAGIGLRFYSMDLFDKTRIFVGTNLGFSSEYIQGMIYYTKTQDRISISPNIGFVSKFCDLWLTGMAEIFVIEKQVIPVFKIGAGYF